MKQGMEEAVSQRPWLVGGWLPTGILTLAVLGVGCTKARVSDIRAAPTGLAPEDAITVILAPPRGGEYSPGLESKAAGCVRNALQQTHSGARMVPQDEFRQVAFAGLSPEELPQDDPSWERLVGDPSFLERVSLFGLRYLIVVSVQESAGSTQFDWEVAHSGDAGALVLNWSRDRYASIEATVVDIMHRRVAGSVRASAHGKSASGVVLFMLVLPIPYGKPSFPVGSACWVLGEGVAKFLAGENPPKP